MVRPLRIEFPGAFYHVSCRGNRRENIFRDRIDRIAWIDETECMCRRFHFIVHAYCQMSNHYHMLIETPEGNLGQGMRQLNGAYSQYYNRRHNLAGHVMQGRYHAVLVQKESYLRELSRYILLNPVRAGIVQLPGDWEWSSYRYMQGAEPVPSWLTTDWLLACFGSERAAARQAYARFVMAGIGEESPLKNVSFRCILGDDAFVAQHRNAAEGPVSREIAREQRRMFALSLDEYASKYAMREIAMSEAYRSMAFTMSQIAVYFGVSVKTVSRAVAAYEKDASPARP